MQQYIDFYTNQSDVINARCADPINRMRDAALTALKQGTWARLGDENYEITDLYKIFEPDYGINVNRVKFSADLNEAFRCDVPNLSTWLYFIINDTFRASRAEMPTLPSGVLVMSLCEAAKQYPELVKAHYGKIADLKDQQVALNTLMVQDGVFIRIPDNVCLERPIQLVNILNSAQSLMANRRILISVGRGAQGRLLICDHTQNATIDYLASQVIEISMEEDSVFDLYDLEESSARTNRVSSLYARQGKGSNLLINGMTLINGTTRNNYYVDLDGEHTETHLLGMGIGNNEQHIDNHTLIAHNSPHCHSNELFKYVLDDNSRGAFTGKIKVKEGAIKTEAYQSNKNIVASSSAKMHSKPQLEIYADDVKCSHGATVGQLDQNALFYMRTRGLTDKEARTLLMQAFMSDVINHVRLDVLRDRLRHLVEKRFYGTVALCSECSGSCH